VIHASNLIHSSSTPGSAWERISPRLRLAVAGLNLNSKIRELVAKVGLPESTTPDSFITCKLAPTDFHNTPVSNLKSRCTTKLSNSAGPPPTVHLERSGP